MVTGKCSFFVVVEMMWRRNLRIMSGLKPFYPLVIFPVLKDGVNVLYANTKVLLYLGLECSVVQIEEVC